LILRTQLLSQTERVLAKHGFRISRDYVLLSAKRKAIGWRPSIYATKRNEKLAIEILPTAEIPRYLVNTLRLCKRALRNLRVELRAVVPRGSHLSEDLRNASLEFDIPILEVSGGNLKVVFSKQISQQVAKALPDQVRLFRDERAAGRHIPGVLLNCVREMRHVKLKNQLCQFAREYESEDFSEASDPLKAEYEFVLSFITKTATRLFGSHEAKRLDLGQKVERMRLQSGDYRDHFIHAFQVFVLGLVIIDRYIDRFQSWMRSQKVDHLEETWFLASIFHDIQEPLENAEWLGENDGLEIGLDYLKWKEIIALLAATYRKRRHGKKRALKLEQILSDRYTNAPKNHGILAALEMINCASGVNISKTSFHVTTAAQSVALHDKKIWADFHQAGIMPLTIEEDPIAYLLIYCDAAQEWGRPGKESSDKAGLVGVNMGDGVQCIISFQDSAAATPKLAECENVRKHLRTTSLKCDLLVTVM
jgi:hypothetical protein